MYESRAMLPEVIARIACRTAHHAWLIKHLQEAKVHLQNRWQAAGAEASQSYQPMPYSMTLYPSVTTRTYAKTDPSRPTFRKSTVLR